MAEQLGLAPQDFAVVTLHRPANVDHRDTLAQIVTALRAVSRQLRLVFVVHPRTRKRLEDFGLMSEIVAASGITMIEPVGYIQFMSLVRESRLVITDSGGVQEETTYLDIPCMTLRDTTERPITVMQGTNRLVTPDILERSIAAAIAGDWPHGRCPALWDGHTAGRVVDSLRRVCGA
jgi:UDP-N-acetylglucosamine 2-epimerase (non-hydrolysing)